MSQKSGFLIVLNGFFVRNVGHTLTKNYNGTYWPLNNIGKRNIKTTFSFRMATTSDIEELIGEINDNRPMGIDLIPPKILNTLKRIYF